MSAQANGLEKPVTPTHPHTHTPTHPHTHTPTRPTAWEIPPHLPLDHPIAACDSIPIVFIDNERPFPSAYA
ncbi:MAG: hypothetical protein RIS92_2603 [Verrucomicrobiota bacterium]|jgi:hypothetical protein